MADFDGTIPCNRIVDQPPLVVECFIWLWEHPTARNLGDIHRVIGAAAIKDDYFGECFEPRQTTRQASSAVTSQYRYGAWNGFGEHQLPSLSPGPQSRLQSSRLSERCGPDQRCSDHGKGARARTVAVVGSLDSPDTRKATVYLSPGHQLAQEVC